MKSTLVGALSNRIDGYWELLATAAGHAESVERTVAGLSAEALTQGAHGQAIAPSIVDERVEALAAFEPRRLMKLAGSWKSPEEIGDDPWWIAAWRTSLRHLKAVGAVERTDVDFPGLSTEAALLWSGRGERTISWRRFTEELKSSPVRYEVCRGAARCEIDEESLSVRELEDAPWQMLRLLRGRARLLAPTAVALLVGRASSWTTRDPLEMALVAEICADRSPATNGRVSEELIATLPSWSDPRDLIPMAYVILGDWRPP